MNFYKHWASIICIIATLCYSNNIHAIRRNQHTGKAGHMDHLKEIGLKSISEEAAMGHVGFLAHDLLEGRQAGTRGAQLAQQYIISHMKRLGLQPYHTDSYLQPFTAVARPTLHHSPRYYIESDSITKISESTHHILNMANVIATIPGTSPTDTVVIGAHFDHEGISPTLMGDNIYNGADDNASGVSAVLQIMQAFATSGVTPKRTLIFAFWDGEEMGLLGSRYFTQNHHDANHIKGYMNFDMVGGNSRPDNPQYFVYFYTESHPKLGEWLKEDIDIHSLKLRPNYRPWANPIGGSDQTPFARHGIPIVWYHTDAQPHYNQPSDEPQTINYQKLTEITRAAFLTAWHMANNEVW